jgi:CRISPR-associated protein Cmr6
MAYPKTREFRPVCRAVHEALGRGLPSGPFNFGLYFMKWLFVADGAPTADAPPPKKAWACCLSDETKLRQKGQFFEPNMLLDNLEVSLALFNHEKQYAREVLRKDYKGELKSGSGLVNVPASWDRQTLERLLQQRHKALEAAARSFASLGYEYLRLERTLASPLVLGLGLEHPSEKGFRFDWTLGLPVIPASGIKGVVRLAWLVEELNRQPDQEAALRFADGVKNDNLPPAGRSLFGAGGEKDAVRGQVIFLDAYPQAVPRLKAEIMNCHYPDYLNKASRGPTEDQRPNPQKFWAVDPLLPDRRPLAFVFRLLLSPEVSQAAGIKEGLLQAFEQALAEHGLGAKTAVGHGRFRRPALDSTAAGAKVAPPEAGRVPPDRAAPAWATEVWETARLAWSPGDDKLTAIFKGKKAVAKGLDLVPPEMRDRLRKTKGANARVSVEVEGRLFRLVKIEPCS